MGGVSLCLSTTIHLSIAHLPTYLHTHPPTHTPTYLTYPPTVLQKQKRIEKKKCKTMFRRRRLLIRFPISIVWLVTSLWKLPNGNGSRTLTVRVEGLPNTLTILHDTSVVLPTHLNVNFSCVLFSYILEYQMGPWIWVEFAVIYVPWNMQLNAPIRHRHQLLEHFYVNCI